MLLFLAFVLGMPLTALSQDAKVCAAKDTACLLKELETVSEKIDEARWRDQTYRELAKLLTHEKKTDEALALIEKVENSDTRAMTIRGIGVAAAETDLSDTEKKALYDSLILAAQEIESDASRPIALRYVAKGQVLAGFDDDGRATTVSIDNLSQRDKAYEEIAEVEAKQNKLDQALQSIAGIESPPYRDRARSAVSRIFAGKGQYEEALTAARAIENAYTRADALRLILTKQIMPEEADTQ
ncbi:MAG: hypothetical protein H6868_06355 [Rhodospirillales bacterium]|nr:hypothetical protein [Rhodospirillales bacterium]